MMGTASQAAIARHITYMYAHNLGVRESNLSRSFTVEAAVRWTSLFAIISTRFDLF